MNTCKYLVFGALVLMAVTGCGFNGNLVSAPGYAELRLSRDDAAQVNQISLGKIPISIAVHVLQDEEPELAKIIAKLDGIRVYHYNAPGTARYDSFRRDAERAFADLAKEGWESIVKVNEGGESINILTRIDGDVISGIVILAIEAEEIAFVNIIGELHPDELNRLVARNDVDYRTVYGGL